MWTSACCLVPRHNVVLREHLATLAHGNHTSGDLCNDAAEVCKDDKTYITVEGSKEMTMWISTCHLSTCHEGRHIFDAGSYPTHAIPRR